MNKKLLEQRAEEKSKEYKNSLTLVYYTNDEHKTSLNKEWNKGAVSGYKNGYIDGATEETKEAREIIKEYIRLSLQEDKDMIASVELFKRAEQFLKESEK